MKIILLFISIILILGFQRHEPQFDYSNHDVMKYLKIHTDKGFCIMQEFLEKCDEKTNINGIDYSHSGYLDLFFRNAKTTLDSISHAGDYIHESIHALSKRVPFSKSSYYFFDCNRNLTIKHTSTFKSKKIITIIPDRCKTFRYETYVIGLYRNQSTQLEGIYGLLDEFNAYYQGVKSKYDFKTHINDSLFLPGIVMSEMQAYYEFKYYIITYLIYAEENYKSIFDAIMNNDGFKAVFKYVDTNFGALVNTFVNDGNILSFDTQDNIFNIKKTLQTSEYQEMLNQIY